MTSVVDKYYRKIIQNIDNVRMKFDISSLLVKSKEHDSKINTNESDISSNLSKIETNESDISSNLSKIETNESNITNNFNISKINEKKSEFNTSLIDNNVNNINSINDVIENCYKLKDIIIFDIVNNTNSAISQNSPKFSIIKNDIVYNFKKDSYIEVNLSILIYFILPYIKIQFFYILLQCFDDQNELFKKIKMPLIGMINKQAILSNMCVIKIPNNFEKIYFELSIVIQEGQNRSDIIKIIDFDNHVYFKILEK